MVKSEHKIQSQQSKTMSSSLLSSSPSSPPPPSSKKKFKGVRMRSWGSWVSEIRAPNQKTRIWLGSYSTPEAAARAYDAALLCLKGSSANLNFPMNPSYHIPDTVMSPKSIQKVAAAAANSCFDTNIATPNPPQPPPSTPPPSLSSSFTSSSISSSPSMSSSFSDQIDDGIFLAPSSSSDQCYYSYSAYDHDAVSMANTMPDEPWFDAIQSPNIDPMMSTIFFDSPTMMIDDQLYEDNDIRLWSFC